MCNHETLNRMDETLYECDNSDCQEEFELEPLE